MSQQTVLVVGGAGTQGAAVVRALSEDPKYAVRALTRNPESEHAKELLALPHVSLVKGDASNEADLRAAFKGVDLAFVNTNSFAMGIRAEAYWGIRTFQIAIESGVKHYVYSGLPDALALSGYDERYRVGHFEGKSQVTEWMKPKAQSPMKSSVVTTGPYIEMLSELLRPTKDDDGTFVFRFPLNDGAVPFVHLDDIGMAVKWLLDHPEESAGLNLQVSVEHASGQKVASSFTAATGLPARYESVPIAQWMRDSSAGPLGAKMGAQHPGNTADDPTLLTVEENFTNWWHCYQESADNKGLLRTDYDLLDKLLPNRVKSVEEWMKKVGYTGEKQKVLQQYSGH